MPTLDLKPTHAAVKHYYDALHQYGQLSISHENAVKTAFHGLLAHCGRKFQWSLIPEWKMKGAKGNSISVDGALVDSFRLARGYWEAKDEDDDLEKEVKRKFERGYPKNNIIFQEPERAILWQNGLRILDEDITRPELLVATLKQYFEYRQPHHELWETAVSEFKEKVPELAAALKGIIEKERWTNKAFVASFEAFVILCRQAINPNLSDEAIENMLIQHLLTERIFRKIFDNPDFTRRNVIAIEIEKVIDALTSKSFNRDKFLQQLDIFYKAIETNAENATDYSEKQGFLNTVYERFFQGYSAKEADTHGIVYTPQPIVDFMVRSVEDILQKEFGKSLSDEGVHILDPFVGTGNFIVRVMKEIKSTKLRQKYENELHCNEIMLLPYYIASMNIEHEYLERMGEYKPFSGICLVDTFELAEAQQSALFTAENTARVERQKRSPITVIIGNPPYNAGQANENDNNKNRKYKELDKQIAATYGKDSRASNKNALTDPYIRAIRWASSRVGENGIVAFVSNNSFLRGISFDGLRKHLMGDFWKIVHVNLKGDARTSAERRKEEGGNIFEDAIRVSVGITFLLKKALGAPKKDAISIYEADNYLSSNAKSLLLINSKSVIGLPLRELLLNDKGDWVSEDDDEEYSAYIDIGGKLSKATKTLSSERVFLSSSNGLKTNRDSWAYNQNRETLSKNIRLSSDFFNDEVLRWQRRSNKEEDIDQFVTYDARKISWSRDLKLDLQRKREAQFQSSKVRSALYRPFQNVWVYFDRLWNEEVYSLPTIFPDQSSETQNRLLVLSDIGARAPYTSFLTNVIPDLHLCSSDAFQCFPFYTYNEDGSNRKENITDWALEEFRIQYKDKKITKWDIFHYTYAVLHDPEYRERYAANLKRELPRIPYAPDFHGYAKTGKRLAEIHVEYEKQKPYKLAEKENKGGFTWRVEKMRLSKDKTALTYNEHLTLSGIPPEVYEYRLGNRSALEWVVDQYQVSTDKRSGIVNDPNREDDPEYIYRLIGRVITVSLETVEIVKQLPGLGLPKL